MSVISRREWMKQGLKATAYVAPAVISMSPAPAGAQVTGACRATLRLEPPTSSSVAFRDVRYIGTGFTPNGNVTINQNTNQLLFCRSLTVIPSTTIVADALGNFDVLLPPTALSFGVVSGSTTALTPPLPPGPGHSPGQVEAIDQATGCSSGFFNFLLILPSSDPVDSLTLRYVSSPVSTPLALGVPPVLGENGSGTVIVGQCANGSNAAGRSFVELRMTLTGATPNRTFTFFITVPPSTVVQQGTVTTDAAGNATVGRYLPACMDNIGASATLSLTIDGNPPGANNVAYRTSIVRNAIPVC